MMIHQFAAGKWVFDFQEGGIYWCTADPGWVTGTSSPPSCTESAAFLAEDVLNLKTGMKRWKNIK